jgi:hypothetical protein
VAKEAPTGTVLIPGDEFYEDADLCQVRLHKGAPGASVRLIPGPLDNLKSIEGCSMALVDGLLWRPWDSSTVREELDRLAAFPIPVVLTECTRSAALPKWVEKLAKEAWLMTSIHTAECRWSSLPSRKGMKVNVSDVAASMYPKPGPLLVEVPRSSRNSHP